jgi:hypothetical protein
MVVPTVQTNISIPSFSDLYIWYSDVPGGVLSFHGLSLVPSVADMA